MGEKGPKTYMKNINEKARERERNLKPSVVLCGVCTFWEKKGALCWQRLCVLCRALFSFLFLFLFFFKVRMYNLVLRVYVYSRDVGVLDLYSSSASDASVCIGTPVLFGVV